MTETYDPLYLKGIEYFNACDFFEAHEAWEELWTDYQGPSRKFYQGLIQVAVALHHFGNGNIRGAKKLYGSSTNYLTPYRPHYEGLDLEKLLAEFERCFALILASTEQFPEIEVDPELIPEIHLDPPPRRLMSDFTATEFDTAQFSGVARLFPLPNVVLFPGVMQPLHVFEPRYREMLEDSLACDRLIAVSLLQPGWQNDYDGRPPVAAVACLGRVVSYQRETDGRYNLLLAGLRRVRIERELPPARSFRQAEVTVLDDVYPPESAPTRPSLRSALVHQFRSILPRLRTSQEQLDQFLEGPTPLGALADLAAYALDLDFEIKRQLLSEVDVDLRAAIVLGQLDRARRDASLRSGRDAFPPLFSAN